MMFRQPIVVFCDGAAKGNPGPGGWGAVSVWPDGRVVELGGREAHTTNNMMELTAAIRALAEIREREAALRARREAESGGPGG